MKINYCDLPASFKFCFNNDCPLSADCLHRLAADELPAKVTWGPAVYPTAVATGRCPHYKQAREVRMAWGFDRFYDRVLAADIASLRAGLRQLLGGNGTYYRYQRGERLLTPEQQQLVIDYFARNGYPDNTEFEGYRWQVDTTGD